MDFDYRGNHDEVIAEALLNSSGFGALLEASETRTVSCCPSMVVGLSEDCRLQARVAAESRTTGFELRNENYKSEDPISLYFAVRRYPKPKLEQCDRTKTLGKVRRRTKWQSKPP
ncbi:MAG: hypothetical protein ACYSUZ_06480 [Planctomycetota bacterium]